MPKFPPEVNGIMDLTEAEVLVIQDRLIMVQQSFVPTDDAPTCDTFQLVVCYKQMFEMEPDFIMVNGDTAEYCLSYEQGVV